ncbi:MAG: hypothetical protein ACRDN9_04365 [Streptosporangiaceae bacterium]
MNVRRIAGVLAGALAATCLLTLPGSATAGRGPDVRTMSVCWYRVEHVHTRLRVHSDPYVGAPVVGYLHPRQWVRGECTSMWSVDRYWVHVVSPVHGYADAHYLRRG